MLELAIVIPCYNEPDVVGSVQSISDCQKPSSSVSVTVVVNSGEQDSTKTINANKKSIVTLNKWKQDHCPNWIRLKILDIKSVPKKIAGVGHARKMGMDHAFELSENSSQTIIVCYDADCICSSNYLIEIEKAFQDKKKDVATLYFEHTATQHDHAIVDYELFLRYHFQGLKSTGYPYAYQTIGSSMAVRASCYNQFGGMNQRKAGEDFYFLHKLIPYREIVEINSCAVYPSARKSDRVPFGTGHAVEKHEEALCKTYYAYDPKIYRDITHLVTQIKRLTLDSTIELKLTSEITAFLEKEGYEAVWDKFKSQAKNDGQYQTSVFRWLNGFRMLKLVHFIRDKAYTNLSINECVGRFWATQHQETLHLSNFEWLQRFRNLEKEATSV